jgi:TusA-related sulfurtransferase
MGIEHAADQEMAVATVPNITLDLRGLANPDSILRLADAVGRWVAGDSVRVLADDSCFVNDFLRWRDGSDLDLLSLRYLPNQVTELTLRMPPRLHKHRP